MRDPKTSENSQSSGKGRVILELIQYNEREYAMQEGLPVDELLSHLRNDTINWVNVDGLEDKEIMQKVGDHFKLHLGVDVGAQPEQPGKGSTLTVLQRGGLLPAAGFAPAH